MEMYEIGFPKKVYSGLDSVEKLPGLLEEQKAQKVLVMTDSGVYPQDAFQKVLSLLEAYDPICIHDIPPEPSVYDGSMRKRERPRLRRLLRWGAAASWI